MKTKCKKCNKRILGYNTPDICDQCKMWEDWGDRNIREALLEVIIEEKKQEIFEKWFNIVSVILLLALIILIIK